jgi:hypothetical protein
MSEVLYRATELFAFQGIRATAQANPTVPEVITSWPSLPSDPLLASIQPSALDNTHDTRPGEELDVRDATNRGSLLVISDTSGGIRCFLDGSYPLGSFNLVNHTACRMHKDLATYTLFGNFTGGGTRDIGLGSLRPFSLHYPELESPVARRLAQLATSARELVWYMKQLLRDAKSLWYGSDHKPGARDLGPKWITTLADKIRRHGGCEFSSSSWLSHVEYGGHRRASSSDVAIDDPLADWQTIGAAGRHVG